MSGFAGKCRGTGIVSLHQNGSATAAVCADCGAAHDGERLAGVAAAAAAALDEGARSLKAREVCQHR